MIAKNIIKYGTSAGVGVWMAVSILHSYGFSSAVTDAEGYRILADAFTVPGVVIFLFGVLAALANKGAFEGVTYAVTYAVKMLIPGWFSEQETYGDYLKRRRGQGKLSGYGFLYITGGVFLTAAVVFIALFYAVS